jgi:menaquinol-cytochrome c reductase iron-sulfur subunit
MSLDGGGKQNRREFFSWVLGIGSTAIGALLAVPGASYVLDPLLRSSGKKGRWVRVAEFSSLNKDQPVTAPVVGEQVDAWTKSDNVRLGTVWLRVVDSDKVIAYNAECPHLGCKVGFNAEKARFGCPCHDSSFGLDGKVLGGPAPRGMDELETRVENGHVEVRFVRFRAQVKERIEIG